MDSGRGLLARDSSYSARPSHPRFTFYPQTVATEGPFVLAYSGGTAADLHRFPCFRIPIYLSLTLLYRPPAASQVEIRDASALLKTLFSCRQGGYGTNHQIPYRVGQGRLGSALRARNLHSQRREIALRILTRNRMILRRFLLWGGLFNRAEASLIFPDGTAGGKAGRGAWPACRGRRRCGPRRESSSSLDVCMPRTASARRGSRTCRSRDSR